MPTGRPRRRAPFGVTLALATTLAVAAFAVVMPLVMLAIPAKELPPPFPAQHQTGETLSYLLTFAVILPLAILMARRLGDSIASGPNARALSALAGLVAAGTVGGLVAVKAIDRLEPDRALKLLLVAAAIWWLVAGPLLSRAARPVAWPALARLDGRGRDAWALAGAAGLVGLVCFARLDSISLAGLVLAGGAAALALAAYGRGDLQPVPRPWGLALDVVVLGVVLLLVPDLVIFRPEAAAGDVGVALETGIIQFHHNFLLGPASEVLHGRPMLVGTASQYGVSSIYLLTAWFAVAPIGYGTLGLLTGGLTALWFGAGYGILRLAGTPRGLSAAALGMGIVVLVFNLPYPIGSLPQSTPLRFGLPLLLILVAVLGERFPRRAGVARIATAGVVGLSSIWALEAFVYTAMTFLAVVGAQAWFRAETETETEPGPRSGWMRALVRGVLAGALACVLAHLAFAGATLALTGELPDWGEYLAYIREFLLGDVGDLTYDVARWTPGLALGAGYLASATALAELGRRPAVAARRPALIALAGVTAYGIALLSYYVDRSQDHILIYVALPGVLTGALWLGLLLRSGPAVPVEARIGGLAFGLAVAVLVLSVASGSIGTRFERSPLAHAAPGGRSLREALDRLWHAPPLAPAAPAGQQALARYMPGERRSLLMVAPDLGLEILLRADRSDRLLLGDPWEASFIGEEKLPNLRAVVAGLRPGERMLMDQPSREVMAMLRARPSFDPLESPLGSLAPLQQWALRRIDRRFALRQVAQAPAGFTVVELARRG